MLTRGRPFWFPTLFKRLSCPASPFLTRLSPFLSCGPCRNMFLPPSEVQTSGIPDACFCTTLLPRFPLSTAGTAPPPSSAPLPPNRNSIDSKAVEEDGGTRAVPAGVGRGRGNTGPPFFRKFLPLQPLRPLRCLSLRPGRLQHGDAGLEGLQLVLKVAHGGGSLPNAG